MIKGNDIKLQAEIYRLQAIVPQLQQLLAFWQGQACDISREVEGLAQLADFVEEIEADKALPAKLREARKLLRNAEREELKALQALEAAQATLAELKA